MRELFRRVNLFAKGFNVAKYLNDKTRPFKEVDSKNGIQLIVETCPFCKNKNYKGNIHPNRLYIRADDKRFICYNCSATGNIIKLLAKFESLTDKDIVDKYIYGDFVELLPDELKIVILEEFEEEKEERQLEVYHLPTSFFPMYPFNNQFLDPYQYLFQRGLLDNEILKTYDIRYSNEMRRIVFPIHFGGEARGWQGRDITGQQDPKYLINKGLQKQLLIYNYDNIKDKDHITITEGPIDAIKSHKINGTCLFGKYLSDVQLRYLLQCPNLKAIYMCLDDDPLAQESQQNIAERLSCFFEIYMIKLPPTKDAGDMTFDEMVSYKGQATPFNVDRLTKVLI